MTNVSATAAIPSLLKTLEDMMHNKTTQKKIEMHKTRNRRADITDRV
jgi:hypothetical protein